jgi:sugar O-acyltransferase (sialic acid O-acetyltransferase NeuD family)
MTQKDIVIVGSGGAARDVKWLIEECNRYEKRWNIIGWISQEPIGTVISGLPVIGDDDWLLKYTKPIDAVVAVGSGKLRKKIVSLLKKNPCISFPNIIAPTAELSDSVTLGEGAIISAKTIMTVDIKIGAFFFCNVACIIEHDCAFGAFVTLSPGSIICGNVTLGEGVTIGTGASIIQGISVGEYSTVGAGATVIRDIDKNCTSVGVPAKILEKR